MELGKFKTREVQPTVLRLHPELRDALIRLAAANGRSLTKEIAARLQASLRANGPTLQAILAREEAAHLAPAPTPAIAPVPPSYLPGPIGPGHRVSEKCPPLALTGIDQAMLDVFRALPPEKQLALLSLFR